MLSTLARAEKKPTGYDTEVARATAVKEEANKVLQLVDSLYSPHKESQQFEVIVNRMSEVLEREIEGLYREFVQENIETMVTQSVKTCPTLLTESVSYHVVLADHSLSLSLSLSFLSLYS